MVKQPTEHGNALSAQAVFDREVTKLGLRVLEVEGFIGRSVKEKFVVRSIKFRSGAQPGSEWLAIITAYSPDGPVVAFHSGVGFAAVLAGLAARLQNGSLKWKVDEYG